MFPNGAYSLPVLAAPGLLWAYRRKSLAAVQLYVPLLGWWAILQPFAWRAEGLAVYFIGGVGGLMLLVAEAHREGNPSAIPYRMYGALLTGGALMALGSYEFARWLGAGRTARVLDVWPILALAAAAVALAFRVRRDRRGDDAAAGDDSRNRPQSLWLPVGLVLLMGAMPWSSALFRAAGRPAAGMAINTILANMAMVAGALWLIRLGLRQDRGVPFAAGVIYFLTWAVHRYVDLFGDFGGMLGAALMFFLCGATLFGVAMYWRRRKEVRHG
jgi:hypothetical protein